jgi:hypothetical protein
VEDEGARLSEIEFMRLLVEILDRNEDFGRVRREPLVDKRLRPDIAVEHERTITLIEVRRTVPQTTRRIDEVIEQLSAYLFAGQRQWRGWEVSVVLAIPGVLSEDNTHKLAAAHIQVWDRTDIIAMASAVGMRDEAHTLLGYRLDEPRRRRLVDDLQHELGLVKCGRQNWWTYQKVIGSILEYLFCPPLRAPILESANSARVNRRDLILPNYASNGFWQFMRSHYRADYIVCDAKNHCAAVGKPHVLQLANYLAPHGTGMFGIISTRNGLDNAASYTCREQWMLHNKMIITLNDDDMIQMLATKKNGDEPESLIRQKIEDFRLGM